MIPVILSGGSGTRLWPVSRSNYPKQFCEFYDQSFLKTSIERLKPLGSPYILTVENMRPLTLRAMVESGIPQDQAIFEPMGKNTAPAVALLCHLFQSQSKQSEVVGIFSADHLIRNQENFMTCVELAVEQARQDKIVVMGIVPRSAATGFGYIEVKSPSQKLEALPVQAFLEKPKLEKAKEFLASGKHYWNAGMFIFKVEKMIEAMQQHMPDLWQHISKIQPDMSNAKIQYANSLSQSLDYGIMEKIENLTCIPCDIGWSDVGSWDEISRIAEEYPELKSDSLVSLFSVDSNNNYAFSQKEKVIGLIDVENLIVVETPDALLISKKGSSEKVKTLVEKVRKSGLSVTKDHAFEVRPWGGFEVLADQENFKVKTIKVDPGTQLSYQSHAKRSEHWIVIQGQGEVVKDDIVTEIRPETYISIPQGAKHRIRNTGLVTLMFVEIQTGSYFGEDDIVRYEDDYNRAAGKRIEE